LRWGDRAHGRMGAEKIADAETRGHGDAMGRVVAGLHEIAASLSC